MPGHVAVRRGGSRRTVEALRARPRTPPARRRAAAACRRSDSAGLVRDDLRVHRALVDRAAEDDAARGPRTCSSRTAYAPTAPSATSTATATATRRALRLPCVASRPAGHRPRRARRARQLVADHALELGPGALELALRVDVVDVHLLRRGAACPSDREAKRAGLVRALGDAQRLLRVRHVRAGEQLYLSSAARAFRYVCWTWRRVRSPRRRQLGAWPRTAWRVPPRPRRRTCRPFTNGSVTDAMAPKPSLCP